MQIVAGSMAGGVRGPAGGRRFAGVIETDGVPTQGKIKTKLHVSPDQSSQTPNLEQGGGSAGTVSQLNNDREFALASASAAPGVAGHAGTAEVSEERRCSKKPRRPSNLEIVDQDGRAMFPDGSEIPYEADPNR